VISTVPSGNLAVIQFSAHPLNFLSQSKGALHTVLNGYYLQSKRAKRPVEKIGLYVIPCMDALTGLP
jgi:hypothetical protein